MLYVNNLPTSIYFQSAVYYKNSDSRRQQTLKYGKNIEKNIAVNFALSSEMQYFTRFDSVIYLYHMFQQQFELRPNSDCMQERLQPRLYQYHGHMQVDTTTTAS